MPARERPGTTPSVSQIEVNRAGGTFSAKRRLVSDLGLSVPSPPVDREFWQRSPAGAGGRCTAQFCAIRAGDSHRNSPDARERAGPTPKHKEVPVGIHPLAVVHPSVKLGDDCEIGPLALVEQDAVIGDRTTI